MNRRKNIALSAALMITCFFNAMAQENEPITAYVFLSPECPLSQNYTRTLNLLNKEFKSDVTFIGVIPGSTYSPQDIQNFAREYKIRFDILRDTSRSVALKWKASVTPEVVLVNAENAILYRGAIDDWAISPGRKKVSATKPYLKNAIEESLQGLPVSLAKTKPVGCLIDDF